MIEQTDPGISAEPTFGRPVENAPWEEIAAICGPYNCSQALLAEQHEALGLSLEQARRVGLGIAGGMWHGSTCGCLLAAIVAAGCLDKPETIPTLINTFESRVGAISCPGALATPTSCGECIQIGRELIAWLVNTGAGTRPTSSDPAPYQLTLTHYDAQQKAVVVPEGVTEIAPHAFEGNTVINNVLLPRSLRVIGDYAFAGCINMHNIMFYKGLERIGAHAFEGCSVLSTHELTTCGATLGAEAFAGCSALQGARS